MVIVTIISCILISISSMTIKVSASELSDAKYEKLSIDEGLSNENVTTIFQDSKGYMWIGTSDGLNRYDGEYIKIYNCDINYENSLSSTYITALSEDDYGNIWIGTDRGLDILNKDTGQVIRLNDIESDNHNLGGLEITSLLYSEHEDNIMWVGTENGLMKIDVKKSKLKAFYHEKGNENSLTNSSITCLEENEQGSIWVGTRYGINVIHNDLIIDKDNLKIYDDKQYIYNIEIDNLGYAWLSSKRGILVYQMYESSDIVWIIDKGGIKEYSKKEKDIINSYDSKIKNYIDNNNFIFNDSKNNIWISSSSGIVRYTHDTNDFELLSRDINKKDTLSSNSISCFYEDRNGTMWIGTDKGVNILNNNNQFKSTNVNENVYISDKNIVSILEHDKFLWIATKSNGVYIYNKNGELEKHLYEISDTLSLNDKYIKGLFKADNRYIVISTNKDIIVFDSINFIVHKEIIKDGYSSELNYLYDDGEDIWLASCNDFYSFNKNSKEIIYYSNHLKELDINPGRVTYILQDKDNKNIIWLGGIDIGIVKYHKKNGVINQYKSDSLNKDSLINNYINNMIFDNSGNLWVGTNIGLSKFNIKSESFSSYTTADGLSNNFINSITIDNNGNIWISTNKGLNKFDTEKQEFIYFAKMDGLNGYQFNLNASLLCKNGYIFFGSTNGLIYFKPEDIVNPTQYKEKVVIGDIYIRKEKVAYDGKELVLEYNNNDLIIDYFLPNYQNLNYVTYDYMIEGIDSEWKHIGSRNFLDIKSLESGKYTLKLRARDGHGNLTNETTMNIKVKPPIWKTPIAYIIYTIIIVLATYYIINYVKILQNLVDQKTMKLNKQLEENKKLSEEIIYKERIKNNYFVNLSHELRTPINIIVSTVQLINTITKDKVLSQEKTNEYMNIISKSCDNLLKIIGDIIDSSKIETGEYKINKEDNDIVYLVEETALNMSKFIEKKGISLLIDPDMEEKIISCDSTEIERCIINLLGNAVKFTPEGGEIRVYIKEIKKYIEISVEDTGIGISEEDQDFIFKRFSQVEGTGATRASSSGIGLTLVKSIAELHGGYVRLESELNKGSIFTIGLPDIVEGFIYNE